MSAGVACCAKTSPWANANIPTIATLRHGSQAIVQPFWPKHSAVPQTECLPNAMLRAIAKQRLPRPLGLADSMAPGFAFPPIEFIIPINMEQLVIAIHVLRQVYQGRPDKIVPAQKYGWLLSDRKRS